jgi:TonB family protein
MPQTSAYEVRKSPEPCLRPPTLLVEWPSGQRVFVDNLRDLLRFRASPQPRGADGAEFWPDVFVHRPVAWRSMASSALYHVFGIVVIWAMSVTWVQRAPMTVRSPFENSKITYYSVSEYLPEIDTGTVAAPAVKEQKGEPKFAKQKIISLPPAPDNFRQTIVTPNKIKLPSDVPMPNLVGWTPIPSAVPEAALAQTPSQMKLPALTPEVVAPAPSAEALRSKVAAPMQPEVVAPPPAIESAKSNLRLPNIPEPSVIEPPVSASAAARPLGAMNVAKLDPTVAAPALPVPAQRGAMANTASEANGAKPQNAAVQPAPNVAGIGNGQRAVGQLIALGLDPAAVSGPISVPNGSRQGQFAATPEGKPNAPGTPEIKGGGTNGGGNGRGSNGGGGNGTGASPPGISVGPGLSRPKSGVVAQGDPLAALMSNPNTAKQPATVAKLERPRMADIGRAERVSPPTLNAPTKIEEKVFGVKRYYSMTLNMPNLTSAGGSWIMRFAELKETAAKGDVVAPQAMVKVDPAYPAEAMRDRVEGTVMLYAVIRKDGSVGEVKVLRGVEERLDASAREALAKWKFSPGMKNGSAVDLETVVQIPFVARKMPF